MRGAGIGLMTLPMETDLEETVLLSNTGHSLLGDVEWLLDVDRTHTWREQR